MTTINPTADCKNKTLNVQTAAESVLIDDFQNLFLLENYLECLLESQQAIEKVIQEIRMRAYTRTAELKR